MSIDRYGLVAHYGHHLTDGKLLDMSGKGNHGTINGATPTTDHNGRANRGWLINANSQYINCGDINLGTIYGASGYGVFRVGFKYVSEARNRVLLSKYGASGTYEFQISRSAGLIGIYLLDPTFSQNASCFYNESNFVNGEWYFMEIHYDLSTSPYVTMYLNGVQVATGTKTAGFVGVTKGTANLYIGNAAAFPTVLYYNSAIDFVQILNAKGTDSGAKKSYNYWRTH